MLIKIFVKISKLCLIETIDRVLDPLEDDALNNVQTQVVMTLLADRVQNLALQNVPVNIKNYSIY